MSTLKQTTKQLQSQTGSSHGHSKLVPAKFESSSHSKMAAYSQQLANNPEAAHNFLVSAGIITAKGNLRKVFGG